MQQLSRWWISAGQRSVSHLQVYHEDNDVSLFLTQPKNPDLNLIKNMWHELKHFIRTNVKLQNKEELFQEIKTFCWQCPQRSAPKSTVQLQAINYFCSFYYNANNKNNMLLKFTNDRTLHEVNVKQNGVSFANICSALPTHFSHLCTVLWCVSCVNIAVS